MIDIESQSPEEACANDSRFFNTFNHAAVGIAHVSQTGLLLRVNQKASEIFGYSKAELLSLTFQELTYPDDLQKDLDFLQSVVDGKIETYTMEKRYVRKDRTLVWADLTVSMVKSPDCAPYFIAVIADIDDRKRSEEALLQAHFQLARERELVRLERDNFFNLSRDCLAIAGMSGFFLRVNPAFCDLLGYSSGELTSSPYVNFIHPDDYQRTLVYRASLLRKEISPMIHFENRLICKNGSIKWMSWTGSSIAGIGNYISGRDITDLKEEEHAAKRRQVALTTNLKLNAIGMMAANMAHEINNPLTIIYGEACLLRKMVDKGDAETKKLARIAKNVVDMSERIVNIVHGLRSLARDGSSDPMKSIPLQQVFDDTIPFCRGKITSDNIALEVRNVPANLYVCCRSVQLSQALLNLLNNAYDAVVDLPRPGKIEVFTRSTESRIEICVRDSGNGIDDDVRKNLFQPFVSSKGLGHGLGLGLSISKEMIEANGGELFLAEASPQTTFVISLPRVWSEE